MAKKQSRTPVNSDAKGGRLRIGVYPGTFDPVTNGHLDIISRAVRLVDRLVVAVAVNAGKGPLFSLKDRVEMCRSEVDGLKLNGRMQVDVVPFDTLLMDFVTHIGADLIIRGLRAVSDFEYEFQMALMNRHLAPGIETVFMMPAEQYTYISSRLIKEVFMLNGQIDGLVPPVVEERLRAKRAGRPKIQD